jgi:voltage-gated potassium channel
MDLRCGEVPSGSRSCGPVVGTPAADLLPPGIFPATALLFVGFVFVNVFYSILRAAEVNSETLCAGVCGYLLLGLFWAFAYTLLASICPNAFAFAARPAWPPGVMRGFTAIFFSYVTLTSVGAGDIVPISPVAQMLSKIEAMAVMIARLVALHSSRQHPG